MPAKQKNFIGFYRKMLSFMRSDFLSLIRNHCALLTFALLLPAFSGGLVL
jgi:hypothetical protein